MDIKQKHAPKRRNAENARKSMIQENATVKISNAQIAKICIMHGAMNAQYVNARKNKKKRKEKLQTHTFKYERKSIQNMAE